MRKTFRRDIYISLTISNIQPAFKKACLGLQKGHYWLAKRPFSESKNGILRKPFYRGTSGKQSDTPRQKRGSVN